MTAPTNEPRGDIMGRTTGLLLVVTLVVIVGAMAFRFSGGPDERPLPVVPPPVPLEKITYAGEVFDADPTENQDIEVFFTNPWRKIPIPLNSLTQLDRGHVYTEPKGGGGAWELKAIRTATHLTITHESDIGGTYRKQEHTIAVSDLPMELPNEKIDAMASGRFEMTKNKRKPAPVP